MQDALDDISDLFSEQIPLNTLNFTLHQPGDLFSLLTQKFGDYIIEKVVENVSDLF